MQHGKLYSRCSASSSLKITDRFFRYASPCLWTQLSLPLRQPHSGTSSPFPTHLFLYPSLLPLSIHHSAHPLLLLFFTPGLKPIRFSNPTPRSFTSSSRTAFTYFCPDCFFWATRFCFFGSVLCTRSGWPSRQLLSTRIISYCISVLYRVMLSSSQWIVRCMYVFSSRSRRRNEPCRCSSVRSRNIGDRWRNSSRRTWPQSRSWKQCRSDEFEISTQPGWLAVFSVTPPDTGFGAVMRRDSCVDFGAV